MVALSYGHRVHPAPERRHTRKLDDVRPPTNLAAGPATQGLLQGIAGVVVEADARKASPSFSSRQERRGSSSRRERVEAAAAGGWHRRTAFWPVKKKRDHTTSRACVWVQR